MHECPQDQEVFKVVRTNDLQHLKQLMEFYSVAGMHWIDCRLKSGDSPLHVAAREGHIDIVRFLCEEWTCPRFDLEINNDNRKKCLHEAAQFSRPAIVEYLLKQGAEVDSLKIGDWTPLMLACTKTGEEALKTVQVLLEYGANPTLTNKDGWTPLHIAAREGDIDIVSQLLTVYSEFTSSNNGRTALHVAALHGQTKAMELLLQKDNCPLQKLDCCGSSPILEAVRGGYVELVQLLLKAGASLVQVDAMGLGCIHIAAETAHLPMIKFLVSNCGIDVNLPSVGAMLTPLHCAARADQVSALKQLLELGAIPDVRDAKNRSVAETAYGIHSEEIRVLLSC